MARYSRKESPEFASNGSKRTAHFIRPRIRTFLCQIYFRAHRARWIHHGGLHGKTASAARYDCRNAGVACVREFGAAVAREIFLSPSVKRRSNMSELTAEQAYVLVQNTVLGTIQSERRTTKAVLA